MIKDVVLRDPYSTKHMGQHVWYSGAERPGSVAQLWSVYNGLNLLSEKSTVFFFLYLLGANNLAHGPSGNLCRRPLPQRFIPSWQLISTLYPPVTGGWLSLCPGVIFGLQFPGSSWHSSL